MSSPHRADPGPHQSARPRLHQSARPGPNQSARPRPHRGPRRGQDAQAAIEMALVLPIMIVIVIGFVGMMLELRAENEFQTAVDLAAQAALVPPLGDQAGSTADYTYAFTHTLDPSGGESGYIEVTGPITCTGPYLEGEISLDSQGIAEPVTCTAQADLDFSKTSIGLLWFWSVHLSATADAYPSAYRQCQSVATPSAGAVPSAGATSGPLQC
jgi:hypothetical protein